MIGNKYMSGIFKYLLLASIACLILTAMTMAGTYKISNLELTHEKDFTVLTIPGTVGMQVSHQSVVAKDGKPNRIVIDCLNARHNLSVKKFGNLPKTVITGIRTAQYATQPEEVVRVVLDLKKESIYRIESTNGVVKVFVSDPDARPFAQWNSPVATPPSTVPTPVKKETVKVVAVPKKTVITTTSVTPKKVSQPVMMAKVTEPEEVKDSYKKPIPVQFKSNYGPSRPVVSKPVEKLAQVKKSNPPVTKKSTIVAAQKETPKVTPLKVAQKSQAEKVSTKKQTVTSKRTPVVKSTTTVLAQKQVQAKPKVKKPVVKSKPTTSTIAQVEPPKKSKKISKKKSKPTIDLAAQAQKKGLLFSSTKAEVSIPAPGIVPPGSATPKKDVHKPTPNISADKVVAQKPKPAGASQPKQSKVTKTTPPPVKKSEPVVVASVDKSSDKLVSVRNKASKYRRDAAKNSRMRQAQVVQFPQRLVIKYNTGSLRDPFATLIDIAKNAGGGIEVNRIPNIEVLSLVGIIEAPNRKGAALMEDHEGIGYILKPGDRVRNGYVAQVDKKAVYFHINEYGWTRTVAKYIDEK